MRKYQNTGFDWLPVSIFVLLGVLWQLSVVLFSVPGFILPSPTEIGYAFIKDFPILLHHTGVTVLTASGGLLLSIVFGIGTALLMALFPPVRRICYPFFVILQTIPLIVLAPLLSIWLGIGILPKLVVVVLVCFFPITVGFTDGLVHADPELDELLKVMGAGRMQIFRMTRIPQGLPGLFSGLKVAATYSVMGAVFSEWVGAKSGLGIYMTRTMANFKTASLFADIFIVVLITLTLFGLVQALEKSVMKKMRIQ